MKLVESENVISKWPAKHPEHFVVTGTQVSSVAAMACLPEASHEPFAGFPPPSSIVIESPFMVIVTCWGTSIRFGCEEQSKLSISALMAKYPLYGSTGFFLSGGAGGDVLSVQEMKTKTRKRKRTLFTPFYPFQMFPYPR